MTDDPRKPQIPQPAGTEKVGIVQLALDGETVAKYESGADFITRLANDVTASVLSQVDASFPPFAEMMHRDDAARKELVRLCCRSAYGLLAQGFLIAGSLALEQMPTRFREDRSHAPVVPVDGPSMPQ